MDLNNGLTKKQHFVFVDYIYLTKILNVDHSFLQYQFYFHSEKRKKGKRRREHFMLCILVTNKIHFVRRWVRGCRKGHLYKYL